jgi:hypothetical protein
MTDAGVDAKKPKGSIAKVVALAAGSFAAGTSAGVITAKASSGEAVLPLKTFEWVLEHGIAGLLLVIVFILGWVVWRQQDEIKELQEERHDEHVSLEREYRDKVEALLREQVKVTQKTGILVAQTNEVLRSLTLVVDEDDEDDDDVGRGGAKEPKETS